MARAAQCGNHHQQAHVTLILDRSRPLTSLSETPTKQSNSSNGTNRDLSTSIPVSLSAVAGGVKPAQPAIRLFQSGPFFFLLKRHSTRSPRITAYDSLCGNFFTLTNWAAKAPPDLSITPIVKNSGLKLRLGDLNFATQASSFKATF